ncbi:MAG: hypothetical protein ACXWC3_20845, partial [Burkholderiales bacterium]
MAEFPFDFIELSIEPWFEDCVKQPHGWKKKPVPLLEVTSSQLLHPCLGRLFSSFRGRPYRGIQMVAYFV